MPWDKTSLTSFSHAKVLFSNASILSHFIPETSVNIAVVLVQCSSNTTRVDTRSRFSLPSCHLPNNGTAPLIVSCSPPTWQSMQDHKQLYIVLAFKNARDRSSPCHMSFIAEFTTNIRHISLFSNVRKVKPIAILYRLGCRNDHVHIDIILPTTTATSSLALTLSLDDRKHANFRHQS